MNKPSTKIQPPDNDKKVVYAQKNLSAADETQRPPKSIVEIVNIGGTTVTRVTLEAGWTYSEHLKPIFKTDLCEMAHFAYQVSGRLHLKMRDGAEYDLRPGDVVVVPPGHDAWVVGSDPVVWIEWQVGNLAQP